jgi:hypothetical protein
VKFGSWKAVPLGTCSEIGDGEQGHEAVNTEVEGSIVFEAFTRQLVNTQQTVIVCAVVNYRMCE